MKKTLAIFMMLVLCFGALVACDGHAHTWDEGKVTKEATTEADGEKTFTCTECGETKVEAVNFDGATEEVWQESIAEKNFDNVTIEYSIDSRLNNFTAMRRNRICAYFRSVSLYSLHLRTHRHPRASLISDQ